MSRLYGINESQFEQATPEQLVNFSFSEFVNRLKEEQDNMQKDLIKRVEMRLKEKLLSIVLQSPSSDIPDKTKKILTNQINNIKY